MNRYLLLALIIAAVSTVAQESAKAAQRPSKNASAAPSPSSLPVSMSAQSAKTPRLHNAIHGRGLVQTFVVAADAKIHTGAKGTGSLADLKDGERVLIGYGTGGSGQLVAHRIRVETAQLPKQHHAPSVQPHKQPVEKHVVGVIRAINLKNGTLTIVEHHRHA